MVLGHFGVGFGAKYFCRGRTLGKNSASPAKRSSLSFRQAAAGGTVAPKVSLGTLFIAVQWADLLWPVLLLLDVEKIKLQPGNLNFPLEFVSYPITHSLLMGIVWGAVFGVLYWLLRKDTKGALVLGACVVSHWFLDLIVHGPDLPLLPGDSPKLGLGLWNSPADAAIAEAVVFLAGLLLYLRSTRAKNNTGKWSLWLLVVLLVLNQIAGRLSPLPTSAHAIGWAAQYQWIFVLLGYWVDRNRLTTHPHPAPPRPNIAA